jgi:hypothetical protein
MHWTLIEFSDDSLATADQPVVIIPLLPPGKTVTVRPMLDLPMVDCQEIRMAVSPRHALLLTWHDPRTDKSIVQADAAVAAQLNRAVTRQADRQWFYRPGRRPTTVTPPFLENAPCTPISGQLLPGYGFPAALASRRRARAGRLLEQTDRASDPDAVSVVMPAELAA